jgi:hypothetical protein
MDGGRKIGRGESVNGRRWKIRKCALNIGIRIVKIRIHSTMCNGLHVLNVWIRVALKIRVLIVHIRVLRIGIRVLKIGIRVCNVRIRTLNLSIHVLNSRRSVIKVRLIILGYWRLRYRRIRAHF